MQFILKLHIVSAAIPKSTEGEPRHYLLYKKLIFSFVVSFLSIGPVSYICLLETFFADSFLYFSFLFQFHCLSLQFYFHFCQINVVKISVLTKHTKQGSHFLARKFLLFCRSQNQDKINWTDIKITQCLSNFRLNRQDSRPEVFCNKRCS